MLKKLLFTFLVLLMLYSGIVIGYAVFEPVSLDASMSTLSLYDIIDYASVRDYTLSDQTGDVHYYYFCSPENNDCIYMQNTVLKTIEDEENIDLFSILEYVDITDLINNLQINTLKTEWSINNFPAFVTCHVENNTIVIDHAISASSQSPLSKEAIKLWLHQSGLTENKSIETPNP